MIRRRYAGTDEARQFGPGGTGGSATVKFPPRKSRGPFRLASNKAIAIKAFTVLCAAGLVGAFAIAALLPPDMDLGTMLLAMDPKSVANLHGFFLRHAASGIWKHLLMPFLLRPGWLLPAMIGLVAGGIAFSLNHNGSTRQSSRRSG